MSDPTPEQRQATEYERFYPSTPLPRMSDEDLAVYRTYYPNIHGTPDRKKESHR